MALHTEPQTSALPFSFPRFLSSFTLLIFPIVLQNLLFSLYSLVDMLFVSHLGNDAVAAVGAGSQLFFLAVVVFYGLASGGAVLTAQLWGADKLGRLRQVLVATLFVAFLLPLPIIAVALIDPSLLVRLFLHTPTLITLGNSYFTTAVMGYIPVSLTAIYSMTFQSIGRVKTAFLASGISAMINVGLDALLIFGLWFFPALGVKGAALATVIAELAGLILFITLSYVGKNKTLALHRRDFQIAPRALYKKLWVVTWPIMINDAQWAIGMILPPIFFSYSSQTLFISAQIAKQVFYLFTVILMGIADGARIVLGQLLGAGQLKNAQKTATAVLRIALLTAAIFGGLQAIFARPITELFQVSSAAQNQAEICLYLYSLALPLMAIYYTLTTGVLRSGGDNRFTLVADMSSLWLGSVLLCALAVFIFHWPPTLIFLASLIDNAIAALADYLRYHIGRWKKDLTKNVTRLSSDA